MAQEAQGFAILGGPAQAHATTPTGKEDPVGPQDILGQNAYVSLTVFSRWGFSHQQQAPAGSWGILGELGDRT